MRKIFLLYIVIVFSNSLLGQSLVEVSEFGSNPGNLKMYVYEPDNLAPGCPVVFALHGCSQTAQSFSDESGWNKLADRYGFVVVYPEQQYLNNYSYCFNWFLPADYSRTGGEVESIATMAGYAISLYSADENRVFVTGLSAGASMSAAMLAAYPDIFAAGAIMAGVPYGAASNLTEASSAMYGYVDKTPAEWKDLVLAAYPSFTGSYPSVAIFHGSLDMVVSPVNQDELIEQWTAVHNLTTTANEVQSSYFYNPNITRSVYFSNYNDWKVLNFDISGMGHAISIDEGTCAFQGGSSASYAVDMGFHSTFFAAMFFGLVDDLEILGPLSVSTMQSGLQYSVEDESGADFQWAVTGDAEIASGNGSHSISVNWGSDLEGKVSVVKTDINACDYPEISVLVSATTSVKNYNSDESVVFYPSVVKAGQAISFSGSVNSCLLYNSLGVFIENLEIHSGKCIIPLGVPEGIYLIKYNAGKPGSIKIVIID
ncbi:MAG: feruloyl esterase [Marinilabiliales bacterium]|nr:MAG: feruloyl esterase [Marinilabiliales bacterium]